MLSVLNWTLAIFYNYFDAKSLKISLNPARMALVCSICLFCTSRNISADLSYLALSSFILRSHISKNFDCHSGATPPSLTSRLFLLTLLRLFSSVFLLSPMSGCGRSFFNRTIHWDFGYICSCIWNTTFTICKRCATLNSHFRRVNAIAMTHHLVKKIEIWKPVLD